MRAVENRTPVVIASNTGPSVIIDEFGRVISTAPSLFQEAVVSGVVNPGQLSTTYTKYSGDFELINLAIFFSLSLLLVGVNARKKHLV